MKRVAFEEVEYVPAELKVMHERLLNWARWQLTYRGGGVPIASAEGRYRSPQHWHPIQPTIPIDTLDAVEIERHMRLVARTPWRELLKLHYVWRIAPDQACRRLAVRYADYGATLNAARAMIRNVLHASERRCHNSVPQRSVPA
jgi:hypothetical protein